MLRESAVVLTVLVEVFVLTIESRILDIIRETVALGPKMTSKDSVKTFFIILSDTWYEDE